MFCLRNIWWNPDTFFVYSLTLVLSMMILFEQLWFFLHLSYCLQILQIFDFMIQNIFKESTAYKEDTKMNKGKIILCRQLEGRLMVQRVVQGLNVLLISVDGIPGVRFKTWSTKYVEDECRWSIVIWTLQKWGKVA